MMNNITRAIDEIIQRGRKERAETLGISMGELEQIEEQERAEAERKEAEMAAQERVRRQQAAEERARLRQALGEQLGLGTPCHIGHVIKLSGLTERSAGNGWDRATVLHVVLDGPLEAGRLKRGAGDLLCRPARSLGLRSMGISGRGDWAHGEGRDPDPDSTPITCKQCLERLRRFKTAS